MKIKLHTLKGKKGRMKLFYLGLSLIVIGAIMVYGTRIIVKRFNITTIKGILTVKIGGLLVTILGGVFIFLAQFPEKLQFLRIV